MCQLQSCHNATQIVAANPSLNGLNLELDPVEGWCEVQLRRPFQWAMGNRQFEIAFGMGPLGFEPRTYGL
jgi:hypothetical protein